VSAGDVVYLLWHGDDLEDSTPEPKLLGVYSSEAAARERIERAKELPGFMDHPDDFLIAPYTVDKDEWPEGYALA
jgi:hypothetical protein